MSTTTADPWASADQSTQRTESGNAKSTYNAGTAATSKDIGGVTDPFGRSSEYAGQGGAWDPRVPFDDIEGRACIFVPKSFRDDAPDPFNEGEKREEWRVDIVVLEGPVFSYTAKIKESKDAEAVEKTIEVNEFPATFRSQSISQGQLVAALKGVDKDPAKLFLFGVLTRVPQKRDAGKYTIESIAASRAAYVEYVKRTGKTEPDNRQRSTWNLDDREQVLSPQRFALARAWWEQERERRMAAKA